MTTPVESSSSSIVRRVTVVPGNAAKTRSVFAGYNLTGGKDLEHAAEQLQAYLTQPAAQPRTAGKVRPFKARKAARG